MRNKIHPTDLETPFGKLVVLPSGVLASCGFCEYAETTTHDVKKKWNAASRARFGLHKHVTARHRTEPRVIPWLREEN